MAGGGEPTRRRSSRQMMMKMPRWMCQGTKPDKIRKEVMRDSNEDSGEKPAVGWSRAEKGRAARLGEQ